MDYKEKLIALLNDKDLSQEQKEKLEQIFPELAESEDERIRKELIANCRNTRCVTEEGAERIAKWIAWLEKQGEQKPTDNVKPKFKVGDWVIDKQGIVHQIANVIENVTYHTYGYDIVGGGYFNDNTEGVRLWTIQDAKDGDVLVHNSIIFIFIGIENGIVKGICAELSDTILNFGEPEYDDDYCPATKEQRDFLFSKMKEAGYEWDAEKKELKKIEQKSADKVEPKFHEGDWVIYNNDICQIVKLEEGCNILVTQFGVEKEPVNERNLSTAKLWDISDAKDGDVLVDEDDCPFIFKGFLDSESPYSPVAYCGIDSGDSFFACKYNDYWTENECQPATKEQCEQLEKAMVDAGWEFDFEKKELKKISQRIVSAEAKEAMYDKPAEWSEEDEMNLKRLMLFLSCRENITPEVKSKYIDWLKSLKQRI